MDWIMNVGLAAGTLTTMAFFPQVLKTLKTRETHALSLWMYIVLSTGMFLWLLYGLLMKDLPMILANGVSLILALMVLTLKLKYH